MQSVKFKPEVGNRDLFLTLNYVLDEKEVQTIRKLAQTYSMPHDYHSKAPEWSENRGAFQLHIKLSKEGDTGLPTDEKTSQLRSEYEQTKNAMEKTREVILQTLGTELGDPENIWKPTLSSAPDFFSYDSLVKPVSEYRALNAELYDLSKEMQRQLTIATILSFVPAEELEKIKDTCRRLKAGEFDEEDNPDAAYEDGADPSQSIQAGP